MSRITTVPGFTSAGDALRKALAASVLLGAAKALVARAALAKAGGQP